MFPAGSVARTLKLWLPTARPLYVFGLVQGVNPALSRLHWKVLPLCVELNVNVALLLVVGFLGFLAMFVSGGIASIVQMNLAGVLSTLPAASIART